MPGVLLATKESRAASRDFFKMSFGEEIDWAHGVKITKNSEMLRNFETDRLCPMGPFADEVSDYFWGAIPPPSSCAVNLYRALLYDADPVQQSIVVAGGSHKEIQFYYCEKLASIDGPFDFIELSEEQAFYREWKAFLEAKERLQQRFDRKVRQKRRSITRRHRKMGLKPPTEEELDPGWVCPELKCVALIVNGHRQI